MSPQAKSTKDLVAFSQLLMVPICKLLRAKYASCVNSQLMVSPHKHYIIAANHQSMLDPIVILGSMKFTDLMRLRPVRFFAHNGLFNNPLLANLLVVLGCFPSHSHSKHGYGLSFATSLISNGSTILIFPEGRRTLYNSLPAKKGVQHLANHDNVDVIPVKVIWTKSTVWKRRCLVTIGLPQNFKGKSADDIMKAIHDLPVSGIDNTINN